MKKKIDKNDFEKSLHFEGGEAVEANLEKVYILIFFMASLMVIMHIQVSPAAKSLGKTRHHMTMEPSDLEESIEPVGVTPRGGRAHQHPVRVQLLQDLC